MRYVTVRHQHYFDLARCGDELLVVPVDRLIWGQIKVKRVESYSACGQRPLSADELIYHDVGGKVKDLAVHPGRVELAEVIEEQVKHLVFDNRGAFLLTRDLLNEELRVDAQQWATVAKRDSRSMGAITNVAIHTLEKMPKERFLAHEGNDGPAHFVAGSLEESTIEPAVAVHCKTITRLGFLQKVRAHAAYYLVLPLAFALFAALRR